MKRISEIRQRRAAKFIENRLKGKKVRNADRLAARKELERDIHLVRTPAFKEAAQEVPEKLKARLRRPRPPNWRWPAAAPAAAVQRSCKPRRRGQPGTRTARPVRLTAGERPGGGRRTAPQRPRGRQGFLPDGTRPSAPEDPLSQLLSAT